MGLKGEFREGASAAPSPAEVRQQLQRILASPTFQASQCASAFLRYVVERALEGRVDLLRERQLGIELFGCDPSYDTSENSSVRVRATEVRKRLAQYYGGHEKEPQIQLPRGSYVPVFGPGKQARSPVWRRLPLRWLLPAGALAIALLVFRGVWLEPAIKTPLDRFWEPVLKNRQKQVVLSLGRHPVYDIAWEKREAYFRTHAHPPGPPPYSLPRDPQIVLRGTDLKPNQGLFVGVEVLNAALTFGTFLDRHDKGCYVRPGTSLTFEELRERPAILIGGLSNYWTLHFTRDLRFYFTEPGPVGMIVDRQNPGRVYSAPEDTSGTPSQSVDYALVCRLRTESGQPVLIAAGLLQWGCQAAAEFLTDSDRFAAGLRRAPLGWEKKNMQILLRVEVVNTTLGTPQVIDTHFW